MTDPFTPAGQGHAADRARDASAGKPVLPVDTDFDLLREYVNECREHIEGAETALLALETDPRDQEAINTVFRAFHTIKGTSGFLGLDWVRELAHRAESLLSRARECEIQLTGGYADLALEACDALKVMTQGLQDRRGGDEVPLPSNYAALLGELEHPEDAGLTESAPAAVPRIGDLLVAVGKASREQVEAAFSRGAGAPIGEALVRAGAVSAADVAQALRTQKQMEHGLRDATVRVSTERLDQLVNLVGELVILHSLMASAPAARRPREGGARHLAQAGKIVRELQDLTMGLRLVPLRGTFQRMARLTRDLARAIETPVRLLIDGADTEIDRKLVEALNDPLVHMIRNAIDHGVEPIDMRRRAGKPETATLRLNAYHAGDTVVIELADDGRGLDCEKIRARAIARGLIDGRVPLSDADTFPLIFAPGLSTAERVTDVSGRGVGMDVVRRGIDSLKGRIEVVSQPGHGTHFTLRLPLTLALSEAMVLRVGSERFLLPSGQIERSFRPSERELTSIAALGEIVWVQDTWVPLLRLHQLFNLTGARTAPADSIVVAVRAQGRRAALWVDEVLGQQQIVIRPLGRGVGAIPGIGGAAILGDGRVGLVLDVYDLLRTASVPDEAGPIVAGPPPGARRCA
jgi:two-component system, chemotaxis family, sensor kinase CheA